MEVLIRLIRARPKFYMLSENPNVSLGIVDCSLYSRRVMLKEDYPKKRRSQLAYAPNEYNYMEILAKIKSFLHDRTISFKEKYSTTDLYVE